MSEPRYKTVARACADAQWHDCETDESAPWRDFLEAVAPVCRSLAEAVEERDRFSVQLAGCLMASEGSIETTADRVLPGDYAWSLALDKVRALRSELADAVRVAEERRKFYEEETALLYTELAQVREALEAARQLNASLADDIRALSPAAPQEGE